MNSRAAPGDLARSRPGVRWPWRRAGVIAAIAVVVAGAVELYFWETARRGAEAVAQSAGSATASVPTRPAVVTLPSPVPVAATTPPPTLDTDAVDRLWVDGSLRGTALDGDWGRWSAGTLLPSLSLRQRFDALLSAQGEVDLVTLRRWIAGQVAPAHGEAGAARVLEVWDRYLQVQSAPHATAADPRDPTTWQAALAEHSRIRRQYLGSAWAEAFYGAEERALQADAARRSTPGDAGPAPAAADALLLGEGGGDAATGRRRAARVAEFGAAADDRLQANDAAWQAWQRRIAAARAAWQAIDADPALAAPQRREAHERLLAEGFDPDERSRARGLIAPPGE